MNGLPRILRSAQTADKPRNRRNIPDECERGGGFRLAGRLRLQRTAAWADEAP